MNASKTLIDTHLHCLEPNLFSYRWTEEVPPLNGPSFTLDDYRSVADEHIAQALFMEADVAPEQMKEEARRYLSFAEEPSSPIDAVIAACRPEKSDMQSYVENLAHSRLKGFRRILHTQPDELSKSSLFRENISLLGQMGYPFDLCVLTKQLPIAYELISACPGTTFVLNHCGAPGIKEGPETFRSWRKALKKLAQTDNVVCKISGIIAYVGVPVTADSLRPFVETCAENFGPRRILWGSDFPVCNLGADLPTWIKITHTLFEREPLENQSLFFHENARRVYKLRPAR